MKTCFSLTLLLLALLPAAAQTAAPQGTTLRYKFAAGKTTHYKLTTDVSSTTSGLPGGQPAIPFKLHSEQAITSVVQSVAADGSATILNHQDSMTVSMTVNGKPISAPASTETGPRDLGTVTLSPTGKAVSGSVPAPGGASGLTVGMDFSKLSTVQGTLAFPEGPVKTGDTWNGTVDLSKALGAAGQQGMNMQIAVQSTLGGMTGSLAAINQAVRGTFGGTLANKGAAGADATKLDGTFTGAGTTTFDTDAGDVTAQTGAYTLNLSVLAPKLTNPITTQVQITVRRDPVK